MNDEASHPQALVGQMCAGELSTADIKAVCAARGFSPKEASSPRLLENLLLSDRGVAEAMEKLSGEEMLLLHLLKALGKPVPLTVFARLYNPSADGERMHWESFTRRYKVVFDRVRRSFVRRGLLFFAQEVDWRFPKKCKLERLRFAFPAEFHEFLPALVATATPPGAGEWNESVVRQKLLELTTGGPPDPGPAEARHPLRIEAGALRMGEKQFSFGALQDWQQCMWAATASDGKRRSRPPAGTFAPTAAVVYALSQLGPQEWVEPEALSPLLKIFCHRWTRPKAVTLCEAGWQWGCLARNSAGRKTLYRLPDAKSDLPAPADYLQADRDGAVAVDLRHVPPQSLELLARIADCHISGSALHAAASRRKLGRVLDDVSRTPLFAWLKEKAPGFRRAAADVSARWGKQVIHRNILVAEVKDLSLKVVIEKAFADTGKAVPLGGGFIAFPVGVRKELESLVKKSGYAVKTVAAE